VKSKFFILILLLTLVVGWRASLSILVTTTAHAILAAKNVSEVFFRLKHPPKQTDILNILINESEQYKLYQALEQRPVKKNWLQATLGFNDKIYRVKLKLHGTDSIHFGNEIYSYTLKFESAIPALRHYRRIKLIKGKAINSDMRAANITAVSEGLIAAAGETKIVYINGQYCGDYYLVEDVKKELLEREFGITNYSILEDPEITGTLSDFESLSAKNKGFPWYLTVKYNTKNPLFSEALKQYKGVWDNIYAGEIPTALKMFDLEYLAKYIAISDLFTTDKCNPYKRIIFIYDFSRGKFYPIFKGRRRVDDGNASMQNFGANAWLLKELSNVEAVQKRRDEIISELREKNGQLLNELSKNSYQKPMVKEVSKTKNIIASTYSEKPFVLLDTTNGVLHFLSNQLGAKDFAANYLMGSKLDTDSSTIFNFGTQQYFHALISLDEEKINSDTSNLISNLYGNGKVEENQIVKQFHSQDPRMEASTIEQLRQNGINYVFRNDNLVIEPGKYEVRSDVIIETENCLIIESGVQMVLSPNVNIVIKGNIQIEGERGKQVIIEAADSARPFGCFSIIGSDTGSYAKINFLNISGGSESLFDGRNFTGQLTISGTNVILRNSIFSKSQGDDGLNIKYSNVWIDSCTFAENKADQVDLDFCFAKVSNSTFVPSQIDRNGDGLDMSGTYGMVRNCSFSGFLDKGISLGEKSRVIVEHCNFRKNYNAIAVKDQTRAFINQNQFHQNHRDIYTYIKKTIFSSPVVFIDCKIDDLRIAKVTGTILQVQNLKFVNETSRFNRKILNYNGSSSLRSKVQLKHVVEDQ